MRNEQSSRAVPETGVVEFLRKAVQRGGRYASAGVITRDISTLLDALSAKDRELAEARAAKDGAYSERNQCVALIARFALAYGCRVGIAKTAIEGWDEAWHGCVYIDLPTGQVSWHYHDSEAHLFDFLPPYLGAWDGHTTPEKYERVSATFPIRPTETERERDEAMAALREKEERVKALEEAVEPFAKIYDESVRDWPAGMNPQRDDKRHAWGFNRADLLWGDFRRARSVLSSVQPVSGSREQRGNEEGSDA